MSTQFYRRGTVLSPVAQLVFALVLCVIAPFVIAGAYSKFGWNDPIAHVTSLWSAFAIAVGFWLHRSVSALPGTDQSAGIMPSYLISFGLALLCVLMARISYSRLLFAASFSLAIIWFFVVYLTTQRSAILRLGIVAGGGVDALRELGNVQATSLSLDSDMKQIDAVTADFRFDHSDEWEARMADFVLSGIPVYHSKSLLESLTGRCDIEHLSENTFGALGPLPPFQKAKRAMDWILALVVAIILLVPMAIVAILVRMDSPGPALFRQERVGFRAKPFRVYKFRTMTVAPVAGEDRDALITEANDKRITRLGRFLRKSRIDEVPQVFNILRGEMSWIGPRPEAAGLSDWYSTRIPFYRYRHVVYPGITGWAQVSQGHVADLANVKQKLEYDFYYIRNFSVWLDLLIVAKTIKTMLTGFGHK